MKTFIDHDDFAMRYGCTFSEAIRIQMREIENREARRCRIGKITLKGK